MKSILVLLVLIFFTQNSMAETIGIPDPVEIADETNAIFKLKTDYGGEFRFYFVKLEEHDKCLEHLKKAQEAYAALKAAEEIDPEAKLPNVVIKGGDYTFASGDLEGQTVFKVDGCRQQEKKVEKLLPQLKPDIAGKVKIQPKLKEIQ